MVESRMDERSNRNPECCGSSRRKVGATKETKEVGEERHLRNKAVNYNRESCDRHMILL
jgi:hypothetical protein